MRKVEIPFTGPAYESRYSLMSPQQCINFYLRPWPELGEDKYALLGCPGLTLNKYMGSEGQIKGAVAFGDYLYVVVGTNLFRLDKSGSVDDLGDVDATGDRVGIATNGNDVVVVSDNGGYVYNLDTEVLSEITDPDFPPCLDIVHIDGYYLVPKKNSGQVWRSDSGDGSSWGGLAFSTAGADPDNIVSIIVDHRDVYLIGEKGTEVWYNTGDSTFNFARIDGAYIEMGGVSTFGRTKANNAVYIVGRDENGQGQLLQITGRMPKTMSTFPISYQMSKYTVNDLIMFSYQKDGHEFIVCNFPTGRETWVYDSVTGVWHERSSRRSGSDRGWIANCHVFFNEKNLVGDFYETGYLWELDSESYTEGGEDLIAVRTSPIIRNKNNRITVDEVEVVCEVGVGLSTGDDQDTDPKALFSWSKDGGKTWSSEIDIALGKMGEYDTRCIINQLGQGRNWAFRWKISAAVERVILGATAWIEEDDVYEN